MASRLLTDDDTRAVRCPRCGAANRPGALYCETCNQPLPTTFAPIPDPPAYPGRRWLGVALSYLAFVAAHFAIIAALRGVQQASAAILVSCLLGVLVAVWAGPLAMVLPRALPGAAHRARQRVVDAIYLASCALWGILLAVLIASIFLQRQEAARPWGRTTATGLVRPAARTAGRLRGGRALDRHERDWHGGRLRPHQALSTAGANASVEMAVPHGGKISYAALTMQRRLTGAFAVDHTYTVTLSSKGQLTLPVEVRRALGLEQGARLHLTIRNDHTVELVRPCFSRVADLANMPPARRIDLTPEQMRAIAHEDRWREKDARGS